MEMAGLSGFHADDRQAGQVALTAALAYVQHVDGDSLAHCCMAVLECTGTEFASTRFEGGLTRNQMNNQTYSGLYVASCSACVLPMLRI